MKGPVPVKQALSTTLQQTLLTQASHTPLQQLPALYVYTKTCDVHVWPCAHCSALEFEGSEV